MKNIYETCCLCLKDTGDKGDSLIWRDSMQLCPECYKEYTKSDYKKECMLINAIKKYRKVISESEE